MRLLSLMLQCSRLLPLLYKSLNITSSWKVKLKKNWYASNMHVLTDVMNSSDSSTVQFLTQVHSFTQLLVAITQQKVDRRQKLSDISSVMF